MPGARGSAARAARTSSGGRTTCRPCPWPLAPGPRKVRTVATGLRWRDLPSARLNAELVPPRLEMSEDDSHEGRLAGSNPALELPFRLPALVEQLVADLRVRLSQ